MDESIEVPRSEEGGNGLPPEAPIETPKTETPAEKVETVEPTEPTVVTEELFELPDGRKVDAETVAQEYKNLLSDYTRKSQELAKVKQPETITNTPTESPFANPEYVPQTYEELLKEAELRAVRAIEAKEQSRIEAERAIEDTVASQIKELKTIDKNLNENALFLHANNYRAKYGISFPDLKSAYTHMKDVAELTKNVQKTTVENIAKRNDPVSITPGATGQRPDPSQFENARDYLRSLK